jgi:transcriptional regulator with XRE-family HTH domain
MKAKSKPLTTGAKIRAAREAAGLTQAELAEAAGTRQSHLSAVETDRHEVTIAMLQRLASALGVAWRDLAGD